MSEPDNELLEALAALMGQKAQDLDDPAPATDEFLERLAAAERAVNE